MEDRRWRIGDHSVVVLLPRAGQPSSGQREIEQRLDGVFVASVVTALLASLFISLGIRTYARIQKICFYGGLIGLAVVAVSIGAIDPFTRQCAGTPVAASIQLIGTEVLYPRQDAA